MGRRTTSAPNAKSSWFVRQQRVRAAERSSVRSVTLAFILMFAAGVAAQAPPPSSPVGSLSSPGQLRTFELAKPSATEKAEEPLRFASTPPRAPASRENLRTMIGVGYVQGADWGSEILATGSFAGAQVQFNALLTGGRDGLLFDHGSLSVFDPHTQWRVEAGDVFSHLRGVAAGARVSWAAAGNRRPAVAVYAPRRGSLARGTVLAYRDQIQVNGQTLLDAEIASDRSYLLRSRLGTSRFELEAFYRDQRVPGRTRDGSISAGLNLWRGVSLTGGMFRSFDSGDRSEWRMLALRLPLFRFMDLTLERAFAGSHESSQTTSAVMGGIVAGDLRLFHRYQRGQYDFGPGGSTGSVERQQVRSMSTYSRGSRLNLALQLATQRSDTGQVQHWEELQTTVKLTSTTTVRTVTAVPDVGNRQRFQAYFRQQLPRQFALQADYGRLSAYQSIDRELDRPRFKLMLFKTVDLATPARGAAVAGRVLDDFGRGIAGARVKLGPYTADTDARGSYSFSPVPRGTYELSLERSLLPADYAWDGRGETLTVSSTRAVNVNLRVTPLNAIHGRVYVDRNANGRFDSGEGVRGAVLRAGDRLTATDQSGSYSFYNLWPGAYEVRLQSVPESFQIEIQIIPVTLLDGAPVTGADFRVKPRDKPIIWGTPGT
jgi:hypothetical protein